MITITKLSTPRGYLMVPLCFLIIQRTKQNCKNTLMQQDTKLQQYTCSKTGAHNVMMQVCARYYKSHHYKAEKDYNTLIGSNNNPRQNSFIVVTLGVQNLKT